jgi:hypothetical protein
VTFAFDAAAVFTLLLPLLLLPPRMGVWQPGYCEALCGSNGRKHAKKRNLTFLGPHPKKPLDSTSALLIGTSMFLISVSMITYLNHNFGASRCLWLVSVRQRCVVTVHFGQRGSMLVVRTVPNHAQ